MNNLSLHPCPSPVWAPSSPRPDTPHQNTASPPCWGSSAHMGPAPRQSPSLVSETSHLTLGCMWLGVPRAWTPSTPGSGSDTPCKGALLTPTGPAPHTQLLMLLSPTNHLSCLGNEEKDEERESIFAPSPRRTSGTHRSLRPGGSPLPSIPWGWGAWHSSMPPPWHSLCSQCFVTTNRAAINILVCA